MAYRARSNVAKLTQVSQNGAAPVDASCVSARGGLGGFLPEKAQPSKEGAANQGDLFGNPLDQKTIERAKTKARPPKKQFPPMPPDLAADPRLVEAWEKWVKYRKEMGKPVTPTGQAQAFARFSAWGAESSVRAIEHTIFSGWQGLQPAPIEMRGGGAAPRERPSVDVTKLQRPEGA